MFPFPQGFAILESSCRPIRLPASDPLGRIDPLGFRPVYLRPTFFSVFYARKPPVLHNSKPNHLPALLARFFARRVSMDCNRPSQPLWRPASRRSANDAVPTVSLHLRWRSDRSGRTKDDAACLSSLPPGNRKAAVPGRTGVFFDPRCPSLRKKLLSCVDELAASPASSKPLFDRHDRYRSGVQRPTP